MKSIASGNKKLHLSKIVGEGDVWIGNPARCVRKLDAAQIEALYYSAKHYVRLKDEYLAVGAAF